MTGAGARLELPPSGEVHVWHADLAVPDARWRQLAATLALDERERAARLRAESQRRRFVAGRGLLRVILGAYLGLEPGRIRLAYGATGKPHLAGIETPLTFNLAHAEEVAVCAVATGFPVGVDVERLRPLPYMREVAACCLSERERAFLASLRGAERVHAFFRAWTRKEAWLKAVGYGLAFGPERVEVTLAAGEPARLVTVFGHPDAPHQWSLHDLPLRPRYAAALATSRLVRRCSWRRWAWESVPRDSARGESPPRSRAGSASIPRPGGSGGAGGGARCEGSSRAFGLASARRLRWPP